MSPASALQTGIFEALQAHPAVRALATAVVDAARRHARRQISPFLEIGLVTCVPAEGMGDRVYEATVTLHAWSQAGVQEAQALLHAARGALHRRPVALSGHRMFGGGIACEHDEVFPDDDAEVPERGWLHGVARYRVWLEAV